MNSRIVSYVSKFLFLLAGLLAGIVPAESEKLPRLRWSEQLAHELDYDHTIANTGELTPTERADLLAFVLDRFNHPVTAHDADMFSGISDDDLRRLASQTRIELIDLNGDGRNEIVAQGNGLGPCGGTGNCIVLVMCETSKGIQLLLDSRAGEYGGGFAEILVQKTRSNGFRDITLASHVSASDRTLEVFHFVEGKYVRSVCYYSTLMPNGFPEGLKNPKISKGCPGEK